ncbi:Hypothetical protein DPCES_4146 [Desulfitobacterium hafniense]|uniref:Uncharacterized protein n=1 Tax=Desulfitobacterium hafniense TaxID=49338 RepID=A0A098B6Q0_DESHA|nr:Hypothetical protein DPCES_4146 [Desulfitobacterium hafniense]
MTHLEYGEPYAVKVARTVREGAGYFANPPISYHKVLTIDPGVLVYLAFDEFQ